MRLIDADALCNELGEVNMDIYTDEVKEYINSAPTIDIVRCSECVHWREDKFFCTQWSCGTPAVGWCYMAKQTERSE